MTTRTRRSKPRARSKLARWMLRYPYKGSIKVVRRLMKRRRRAAKP